jgi:hypothetical protein
MPISLKDLRLAFEFVSMGSSDNSAFLCKKTGRIYWTSESGVLDGLEEEELPDDLEESDKYLAIPDKYELDLGKPLALAFAREFVPAYFDEVRQIFSKRGAYRRSGIFCSGGTRSISGTNSRRERRRGPCANGAR